MDLFRRLKKSNNSGVFWGIWLLIWLIAVGFTQPVATSQPPRRVISLAPNLTEMIFRLGMEERLVGRTEYCTYPPAVQRIPSVGGYLNPDYETMVTLKADAAFMLAGAYYRAQFQELGIRVFEFPAETVEDILHSLKKMGEIFQIPQKARAVVQQIEDTLNLVAQHSGTVAPTALLVIGHEPGALRGIYVVSNGSFLGQLWKLAGGRNIFPQETPRYFEANLENILAANPDVIVDLHGTPLTPVQKQQCRQLWESFPQLAAVKHHLIVVVDQPGVLIPGPRITRTIMVFQRIIEQMVTQE